MVIMFSKKQLLISYLDINLLFLLIYIKRHYTRILASILV
nr:MAG TPA: hypothetical protein [Bacteriophage sp.]